MKNISPEHTLKIDAGIVEGNLKHMMNRVAGFQQAINRRQLDGKPLLITKETATADKVAQELERFMDFTEIFGHFKPNMCKVMGEIGVISAPKPWKADIYEWKDPSGEVMQEIRYRNIQIWWPIRILQQVFEWSERKVIIHGT